MPCAGAALTAALGKDPTSNTIETEYTSEQPMQNNSNSTRAHRLLGPSKGFSDSTCYSGTCGQIHPAEQHWLILSVALTQLQAA